MTPLRVIVPATVADAEKKQIVAFATQIIAQHLKPKVASDPSSPIIVDRRNDLLGHDGRPVVRDPHDPNWPRRGRTTTDVDEAAAWVASHYAYALWQEMAVRRSNPDASTSTVAAACARYLTSLECEEATAGGSRVRGVPRNLQSRASKVKHVVALFGPMLLVGLEAQFVEAQIDAVAVKVSRGGQRSSRPASYGQKRGVFDALMAVWRHQFGGAAAPFAGAQFTPNEEEEFEESPSADDPVALERQMRESSHKGALGPSDVKAAMVGAMSLDNETMTSAQHVGAYLPVTVYLVAVLVGLGVRISEAMRLRWKNFNFDRGYVVVIQSKRPRRPRSKPKPRWRVIPLPLTLWPWLEELRTVQQAPLGKGVEDYLFRMDRSNATTDLPSKDTAGARLTKALVRAGVKPERYATHWGRATYASWGKHSPLVTGSMLKDFLGHRSFSGTTEDYVAQILELLRPEHRLFIELPSPEAVREALAAFVPPALDWRETCSDAQSDFGPSGRRRWTKKVR